MAGEAAARFKVGDQVRIRVCVPPTHFRTPEYGRIVRDGREFGIER
jgi:hypothetical protein